MYMTSLRRTCLESSRRSRARRIPSQRLRRRPIWCSPARSPRAIRTAESPSSAMTDHQESMRWATRWPVLRCTRFILTASSLDRHGSLETLALPRFLRSAARSVYEPAQTDSHSLADVMRVGASLDDGSGKLRGFRIYPGRKPSAFDGYGLHAGDLVTAVNGTALQDKAQRSSRDAFDSIRALNSATLTIERDGRIQDITINLTPESSDAGSDRSPAPGSG